MIMELLRSKLTLDRLAKSSIGEGWARGAKANDGLIHTHFSFDDYPGDKPHARVSVGWDDVEGLIAQFAKDGHPGALRLLRADRLASAVEELAKI